MSDTQYTKKLGIIKKASLNIKDRGILTFNILVDYEDGFSQGIGGLCLDTHHEPSSKRVGTIYGTQMIMELLNCLNVNDFSEMAGKHLFVLGEGEGMLFNPRGIQALRDNGGKQVIYSEVLEFAENLEELELPNKG